MSEDEDGTAAIFAAVNELEMSKGRRGLVGRNFRDQVTFGRKAISKARDLEEFGDQIRVAVAFPIRWIRKDEIVGRGVALEKRKDISFDRAAAIELGFFQIFIGDRDGLAVFVNEHTGCCTAAEGFQSECSGAAEKIQNAGIEDLLAEN